MASPIQPIADRVQLVRRLAQGLGFSELGIAAAEPTHYAAQIQAWLDSGAHGQMEFMSEHLAQRLDPTVLLPGARSIICVADRYPDTRACEESSSGAEIEPQGRVARYAWGDDYHRVMKKRLHGLADMLREQFPREQFLTTVDTAPILEREHASRAGLGWIGKNTMLIHPMTGSWMLLGEIVTTLPLQTAVEIGDAPLGDHCGSCTRCIDACPTQCITPRRIDASRCVSYLTIEHRDLIPTKLHEGMGQWVAGCDVCQEVCPFNQDGRAGSGKPEYQAAYATRPPGPSTSLIDLLRWTAENRRKAFERSALKRIKLEQLKRNALIAAGNAILAREDARLRSRIIEMSQDENESSLVRETARQVLARLAL